MVKYKIVDFWHSFSYGDFIEAESKTIFPHLSANLNVLAYKLKLYQQIDLQLLSLKLAEHSLYTDCK